MHPKGLIPTPLPRWLESITLRLHKDTALYGDTPPNHVLVNAYLPGEGILVSSSSACTSACAGHASVIIFHTCQLHRHMVAVKHHGGLQLCSQCTQATIALWPEAKHCSLGTLLHMICSLTKMDPCICQQYASSACSLQLFSDFGGSKLKVRAHCARQLALPT